MGGNGKTENAQKLYTGGCHCRKVLFEFEGDRKLIAWDCNCSICRMKRNIHTIIPKNQFRLISGEKYLTTYTFNTHTAKHLFCKYCGVQPYYIPRSNPDGYGITVACIDPTSIETIETRTFDGKNWDSSFESSGISEYSK